MATLEKQPQKKRSAMEAALRALAQSGSLTADRVIEAAKPRSSPLHSYFEWDVSTAALCHWREQARELIRSVEVMVLVEDRPVEVSYFVRDPHREPPSQGYIGLDDLKKQPAWAQAYIQQELTAVLQRLMRAEGYAAILGVQSAMAEVTRSVQKLAARVKGAELVAHP